MTDEEFDHLWEKTDKCKSTTANVTVRKDALRHMLMEFSRLTAKADEMNSLIHSGRKIGDLPPLLTEIPYQARPPSHADQDY